MLIAHNKPSQREFYSLKTLIKPPAWGVRHLMKINCSLVLILLFSFHAYSAEPLSCNVGPIHIELASTKWQVTSCSDGQSLVFATMKGNPAMPFMFFIKRDGGKTRKISGEGNGAKEYTSKAFEVLKSKTEKQLDELLQATKQIGKNN
jgi:hypothetical protein